jgi:regulatory protein
MTNQSESIGYEAAKNIALRSLNMAPRSRWQLEQKLAQKGVCESVSQQVLDRLSEVGLVDDRAFAQMLVNSRVTLRGLAPLALRQELRRKGIAESIIEESLVDLDHEAQLAHALLQGEKKMRVLSGLPEEVVARRLAGFLARKGYSSSLIWRVVAQLTRVNESDLK